MRKKILFLMLAISLVCIFAISVNAETALKPQTNNEYGELSFFDESITVGRTDNANGFTPYLADGESYAKVVIGDGTTFYTFPTYYVLTKNDYESICLFQYDFALLNSAMETATGTNPGWTRANVYRLELPTSIKIITGNSQQKFESFSNLIELTLAPNMTTGGDNQNCLFRSCPKLEVIHNIDTFVFRKGCLNDAFRYNESLKSLTLAYSPNVTGTPGYIFENCKSLESVNLFEAFPNLTGLEHNTFTNCYKLTTLSSARNDGIIHFPSKYTYLGNNVFQNCESIVAIKFSGSSVKILQNTFNSLDNLEYVYFPRDSKLELPSCEVFSFNPKLKAVALPDNCEKIPDRGFKSCASLEAVYLPSNLVTLMTNGGGAGAFAYDSKLYFVQEWFSVLDENGEFLLDEFSMPQRPDVYFFPQTLTNLYDRTGGTGFHQNYKLNPYLVFGTNVTKMIVNDGLLYECGRADNPITAIFLGDMTQLNLSMRDSREKYISYVFANANDKTIADVAIIDNSDRGCSLNGDEYFYFCHGGVKYKKIAYREAYNAVNGSYVNGGTYTAELLVAEENTTHFANPNLETRTEADCVTNIVVTQFCFCTNKMGETEVENSALGHDYKEENRVYTFGSIYAKATSYMTCTRECGINSETVDEGYVIWDKGYSCSEYNNKVAVARSFSVNKELLPKYEEINGGVEIGFGVTPHYDNEVPNELGDFVISAALKNANDETLYSTFSFAVAYGSDEYKDALIYIAGYVRVNGGEIDFIDDTFETISYNSILAEENEKAQ
ncbi:MAG: leucine-rich repeat domain-containing protein [Clostridia bacterium]|nr:leucine-rich repeat domain-containing protein [Clostridia bacterium]